MTWLRVYGRGANLESVKFPLCILLLTRGIFYYLRNLWCGAYIDTDVNGLLNDLGCILTGHGSAESSDFVLRRCLISHNLMYLVIAPTPTMIPIVIPFAQHEPSHAPTTARAA